MDKLGRFEIDSVYCGDCAKLLSELPDGCIDLTVTSPPYGTLRKYNGFVFDFESIASQLFRVTKIGGVVVWVVGDQTVDGSESGESFRQALYFKGLGFNLHDTMIYYRERLPLTHNRYEQHFEYMFVLSRNIPNNFHPLFVSSLNAGKSNKTKTFRHDGTETQPIHKPNSPVKQTKMRGNVWEYGTGFNKSTADKDAFDHPAIFPEALAADHIVSWSNAGDIVLDPMCGSGTTLKMAKRLNRKFLGFDISEEYCELSRKRVNGIPYPMF